MKTEDTNPFDFDNRWGYHDRNREAVYVYAALRSAIVCLWEEKVINETKRAALMKGIGWLVSSRYHMETSFLLKMYAHIDETA